MNKKYYFIIIIFLFISCNKKTDTRDRRPVKKGEVQSINHLTVLKSLDYVILKTEKKYLSLYSIIKVFNDGICIYDDYKIYITNLDFVVIRTIDLKGKDFYFKGRISDLEIIDNDIYILDSSNNLTKISDYDIESITQIKLDTRNVNSIYQGSLAGFSYIGNNRILTTNVIVPLIYQRKANFIEVGKLFDLDGEFRLSLRIPKEKGDKNWENNTDFIYASFYNNLFFISFQISGNVYVFKPDGKLIDQFQLFTDKRYWHEPKTRNMEVVTGGKKYDAPRIDFIPQCANSLQIQNGYIFSLVYQGENKGPLLVRYDLKFNVVEKSELNKIPPGSGYEVYVVGKRIYLRRDIIYILG